MTRVLLLIAVALIATLALGCDDGNDSKTSGKAPTDTSAEQTAAPAASASPDALATAEATQSRSFEELRSDLRQELSDIGVNIGSVPPDIRAHLLALCGGLELFADEDDVGEICTAIDQAIDNGDYGLIDLILDKLDALEED